MKALTFKRGIHPKYSKEATNKKSIQMLKPKGDLVFPMQQHIGSPCKPIVKKGDRVLVGQKIGEATGFVCAPIHSSVSGIVKAVEERAVTNGSKVLSVVIENDGIEEEVHELKGVKNYKQLTQKELVEIVKEAGIVGMGGATFPAHVKLSTPKGRELESIIINGAECEPYLTSDHRVMLEESQRII
ncbi:MAG: electron transporter RnfC, partial [Cellulosilyticaceae bacterium]